MSVRAPPAKRAKTTPVVKAGKRRATASRFSAGAGPELKFFDTANSFLVDATGEVPATGQLSLIVQGTDEDERIGRKCTVRSIHIRGTVVLQPAAAANASTVAYVYVVQDTQCNGAAAAITDVLDTSSMATAMSNLDNSGRFRILKRFVFNLTSQAGVTTAYNNVTIPIEWYKRCSIPLDFSAPAGAITSLRSNNLFLLAGTDALSDDIVSFNATTRLRFSDGS